MMSLFICKMCGGTVTLIRGTTFGECAFCGTKQTIPNTSDEKTKQIFNRANELRKNLEFDEAATTYNQLLGECPKEPEGYWGLCLCKYGIEYVKDPQSGESLPTCYRFKTTSILEDSDYQHALSCTDPVGKQYYTNQAQLIDSIQKQILEIVVKDKPYDVFISYKETDDLGYRTEDSVVAQELYNKLAMEGLRVFYAPVTLEGKQGEKYEPHIFAGLFSSKVLVLIGSRGEYLQSVWVKNEWARFYSMMQTDHAKVMLICVKGSDGYKVLPERFKSFQSFDIEGNRFYDNISTKIINLCGNGVNAHLRSDKKGLWKFMLLQAQALLEERKFDEASKEYDKIIQQNDHCSAAYFGKLLVKYHIASYAKFKGIADSAFFSGIEEITGSIFWNKAIEYATAEEKKRYLLCLEELQNAYDNIEKDEDEDYHKNEEIKRRIKDYIPLLKERGIRYHLNQHKYSTVIKLAIANSDYQDIQYEKKHLQEQLKSCRFFEIGRKKRIDLSIQNAMHKSVDIEFDKLIPLKSTIEDIDGHLASIKDPNIKTPVSAVDYIELSKNGAVYLFGARNRDHKLANIIESELFSTITAYRWIAVAARGNRLLLLSVDAYGPVTYNPRNIPNSARWEDSLLRRCCQGIIRDFTTEEQSALIAPAFLHDDDLVYCLSRNEAEEYLHREYDFVKVLAANEEDAAIHDYMHEISKKEYVSWWLRRGESDRCFSEYCYDPNRNEYMIDNHMELFEEPISTYFRPAIWIDLKKTNIIEKAYISAIDEAIDLVP